MTTTSGAPARAELSAAKQALLERRLRRPAPVEAGIPPRPQDAPAPLSFAQERLWLIDQLEPGSAAYTISAGLRLRGALDVDALRRAFAEIVRRHDVLRTTFSVQGGAPVQVVAPAVDVDLPLLDGGVDFFAMDLGFLGRLDAQTNLLALDLDDHDLDVVIDGNAFPQLPGQY